MPKKTKPIYVPTDDDDQWQDFLIAGDYEQATHADDWKRFLASREKQWKSGYSARSLAYCWQDAAGNFPAEIHAILSPVFPDARPSLILPEHNTHSKGRGKQPQNDAFVVAKTSDNRLISMTIEGKVNESFGQTLAKWEKRVKEPQPRLQFFMQSLGLSEKPPGHIYYQLIHRTASAVIEAQTFNAAYAVMLVHSFSPTLAHFDAFREFVGLFTDADLNVGQLIKLSDVDDIQLYAGWVHGDEKYLKM